MLSQRLRILREERNLLQSDVAKLLNITPSAYGFYEQGKREPKSDALLTLANLYGVSIDYLLGKTHTIDDKDYTILRESPKYTCTGANIPPAFKFNTEISNRLKTLAKERNESYDYLAEICSTEKETIIRFFEQGFISHISLFEKIVEHFLVSSDYLLNRTDSTLTLKVEEEELIKAYRNLNAKSKVIALSEVYKLEREESLAVTKESPQGRGYVG